MEGRDFSPLSKVRGDKVDLLNVTKENIESFLSKNGRSLQNPEFYFGIDNNQDLVENFQDDRLKILVIMLSDGPTKEVSNTFNALSYLVHKDLGQDKVFVDVTYYPEEENMPKLEENEIPYWFGNVSHQPITEYDLVFMSASIVPECLNMPHGLTHCGIPLTIQERDKDNRLPLILFGGAAANEMSIVLGPIYRDGEKIGNSLIDIANYGYGEDVITELVAKFYELKSSGFDIKDKPALKERLISEGFLHDNLFYPDRYEWVYDEDNFTIKEIKKLDDRLPDRVEYHRIQDKSFRGFPLKAFCLSGGNADSKDIQISAGCSGQSSTCSFCMEATVAGRYLEKDLKDIEEEMAYARRTSAPNVVSWFSYNVNYYKHFMDLQGVSAKYFRRCSLLNERLDVVANAPQQFELAKILGQKRFSGAIEGIGERVREKILNKNLPKETLYKAAEVVMSLKVMHFKVGMIVTGQETEEDFDDCIEEFRELIRIRERVGANNSFQANFTPLVLYSQTPLRYLERVTSKNSFNNARTMGRVLEEFKKLGVRAKFNGRGPGTWIEQLLLDFGPAGTDWLVGVSVDREMLYAGMFSEKDKNKTLEELSKRGYDNPLFFCEERPIDWIFPNDHIIYATDKVIEMWKERFQKMDFSVPLCLRTPAALKPTCYNCDACNTTEQKLEMVRREISDEMSLDQVLEKLSEQHVVDNVRVVVKTNPGWELYNKQALSHFITSRFLMVSPEIEEAFYTVEKNTATWTSSNGQKGWFGGKFAFDINLKTRVNESVFRDAIEQVNSMLDSCEVLQVYGDSKELQIKRTSYVSYLGETDKYTMTKIKEAMSNFDWMIKVAAKTKGGFDIETVHMPELKGRILFVPKGQKVLVFMSLPSHVTPYLVMGSILGKGYNAMLDDFRFNILDHGTAVDSTCKCGGDLMYSFIDGKVKQRCQVCEGKLYLAKLTGKI